jgi:hypothetical protein
MVPDGIFFLDDFLMSVFVRWRIVLCEGKKWEKAKEKEYVFHEWVSFFRKNSRSQREDKSTSIS